MEEVRALKALAALSKKMRLRIVRLLIQAGPEGMAAGAIGEAVGVTPSLLSFHLTNLENAGLIASRRDGRFIIYTAVYPAFSGLLGFLMRECCQGHPEICTPAGAELACSASPLKGHNNGDRDLP